MIALGFAGLVNLAIVMMSASVFNRSTSGITDIDVAYHTLIPTLGMSAAGVFPPLPMVALVILSSRKSVMGDFVTGNRTAFAAIAATVLIVLLNIVLIRQMLL